MEEEGEEEAGACPYWRMQHSAVGADQEAVGPGDTEYALRYGMDYSAEVYLYSQRCEHADVDWLALLNGMDKAN